jgi:hypothetical protein
MVSAHAPSGTGKFADFSSGSKNPSMDVNEDYDEQNSLLHVQSVQHFQLVGKYT